MPVQCCYNTPTRRWAESGGPLPYLDGGLVSFSLMLRVGIEYTEDKSHV